MMGTIIFAIIFNVICAIIAGNLATKKGKDVPAWVLLGLAFGVIAIIVLACSQDETRRSRGSYNSSKPISKFPKYKCQECGEMIDTVQCPWCGKRRGE